LFCGGYTFEEISNDRLILGLGAGWHKPEFDAHGIPYDHLASRFEEAVQIIEPLVHGGQVDFDGQYYQAKDCELAPRGSKRGGPPIMIAAFGPRMMRITARYADSWNTDWLGSLDNVNEKKAALAQACHEVGRDPETLEITGGVTIAYPELGELPSWMTEPEQSLSGSPTEIANGLQKYEDAGVSHVMFGVYPHTEEAYTKLGEAIEVFHAR
jgi:alkanesulfonate monooxygenase SsuD/methylene tetrahydromethanopterin reductase-like flavin-dependent oxidoreductase (luciferase family)